MRRADVLGYVGFLCGVVGIAALAWAVSITWDSVRLYIAGAFLLVLGMGLLSLAENARD